MDNIFGITTIVVGLLLLFFSGLFIAKPFYTGRNILTVVAQTTAHGSILFTAIIIIVRGWLMIHRPENLAADMNVLLYCFLNLLFTLTICLIIVLVDKRSEVFNKFDVNYLKLLKPYNRSYKSVKALAICIVGILVLVYTTSELTMDALTFIVSH